LNGGLKLKKTLTVCVILLVVLFAGCGSNYSSSDELNAVIEQQHEQLYDLEQKIAMQHDLLLEQQYLISKLQEEIAVLAYIPAHQPDDYSDYIGVWRGYAIAIYETLVITDFCAWGSDELTFHFVHWDWAVETGEMAINLSDVYVMPIIDGRIDSWYWILDFLDDSIHLTRFMNRGEEREIYFVWRLQRLPPPLFSQ